MRQPHSNHKARGFTLVELAIVLVVIGLIVGGVLVGGDLIRAAEANAAISQIQKYDAAVGAFRLKYSCLPGDCATAASYGFATRGTGEAGYGNGDGILEAKNGGSSFGAYQAQGETGLFWRDLSEANLIDGSFTSAIWNYQGLTGGVNLSATSTPNLDSFFPKSKIGADNWVLVYSRNSTNYYAIAKNPSIQPNGPAFSTAGIRVSQANAIDTKIDDGGPQTGSVTARGLFDQDVVRWSVTYPPNPPEGAYPGTAGAASAYTCYDNGNNAANPMKYTLSQNSGAGLNCALSFKFQ